jgi:hypothetical protein
MEDEAQEHESLSCVRSRHSWKDGWICDHCGKRKADLVELKNAIRKRKDDMARKGEVPYA